MAPCLLTLGRLESCRDSIAGLSRLFLINYGEITGTTVTDSDEIRTLGVLRTNANIPVFEYELRAGTNTFTQNITTSRDNGTTTISQELNITLKKLDAVTNRELKNLTFGRAHAVVTDMAGNSWLCGKDYGMEVVGGTAVTGGLKTDLYGYTLQLKSEEATFAYSLSGSTIQSPFGGLSGNTITITRGTNS